ncbi:MAG: GC-type dockerin domain-anchored protein [Phycisphaerales bacterium]
MVRKIVNLGCLGLLLACGAAQAQPRITSLGQPVTAVGVSSDGGRVLASTNCGPMTFDLAAGVTLTPIANPASTGLGTNCLSSDGQKAWGAVAYPGGIAWITTTGNTVPGYWSQATNSWTAMPGLPADAATNLRGTGTSGNSSALASARGASRDGRYVVGQSYAYPNVAATGWAASGSVFVYRPFIWDTQTNTVKVLPTPPQVNGSNVVIPNRYKDGRAICVSNDASVIMGGYNANGSGGATGGSIAVWYLQGDGTYLAETPGQLPLGTDDSSRTVDSFVMSSDGLIIVGTSFDQFGIDGSANPGTFPNNLRTYITKWTRPDAASRTWTRTKLYDMSASQASATPGSISSWWQAFNCSFDPNVVAYPDPRFGTVVGMSDDGNTIIGRLEYSTCGGFVHGGWIWKGGTGPGTGMFDLYDYLVAQGTIDIANYGMVGTLVNHAGATLGYPTGITADGNTLIGYAGPFTPLGPAWVVDMTGASTAKAPFAVCSPSSITGYTHCSSPLVQFGFAAGGSGTLTYSWKKGTPGSGTQLFNGDQASPVGAGVGANITGADTFLVRVNFPNLADAGSYYCTVSSSNGGSVDSAAATATAASLTAVTNDLCANAQDIFLGTNAADASQEKTYDACAAFIDEFRTGGTSCYANNSVSDVWFKYTPTASGDIRIENCASTYFSSVITVYDACGGNELACSSVTNSGSAQATFPSCSKVRLNRVTVTQDQPVYIRVANQGSASATSNIGKVRIYPSPTVPSNDGCASPATAVIGSNAFDNSESTYDANALIGGVVQCSTALSRDIWYVFTPTIKGTITASTCWNSAAPATPLTTPNTVLTAFEAQCGGTEVVCNDNALRTDCGTTGTGTVSTSFINIGLRQAGQSVWIRVGGNSATGTGPVGPGTLTIGFTPSKCNAADVAQLGGIGGFDGQNTVDDLVYFLAQFFANNLAVADITNLGGSGAPDGLVTVDDLTFFLSQFFSPCN